jgi:hypothetical protein
MGDTQHPGREEFVVVGLSEEGQLRKGMRSSDRADPQLDLDSG